MRELEELLKDMNIKYSLISTNRILNRYIASVSLGLEAFRSVEQTKPLKNHAVIVNELEISALLNAINEENFPKILFIVSENEKPILEVYTLFNEHPDAILVHINANLTSEELYARFINEIEIDTAYMHELVFNSYINLVDLLTQEVDIGEIEAAAYRILKNPMIITDESYKVITYTSSSEISDPIWMTIVGNEYCPSSIVEMTDYNKFWDRLSRAGRPLFVDSEDFSPFVRRAVAQIKSAGKIKGYIALVEINKPITNTDLQILQMTAEIVAIKLKEKDAVSRALGQMENELIGELLSGFMLNEKMAVNRARSLAWNIRKYCSVLCIQASEAKGYIGTKLDIIKDKLNNYFPLCIYSFNGSSASFIISFDSKEKWNKLLRAEIEEFMKKEKLICSCGCPVDSLIEINKSYEQAKRGTEAFEYLNKSRWKKAVYIYSEIAVYNILIDIAEKNNIQSSSLLKLKKVDEEEGSEYITTLKFFFENNQNVTETAKAMYLHRNTINYRLRKIHEILDDDFDNSLVRLHLQMSIMTEAIADKQK
jgi:sugar diacid utilization regulator